MAEINHAERSHALLSASGAKRWLACTPSARLEDKFPKQTSKYAQEGTLAHETAEKILTALIEGRKRPPFKRPELKEIVKELEPYITYVMDLYNELNEDGGAVIFLETKVDFSEYVPEGFGTGDVIIIAGDTLHIIDLKYGKGVAVSAIDNPQLRLYGIGALKEYEDIYDLEKVVMHIAQPRLDSFSHEELTCEELETWAIEDVKPRAQMAYEGKGEFVTGKHCQFCRASAVCRKRFEHYTEITKLQKENPEVLANNGELATIVREAKNIENWLKEVCLYARKEMMEGVKFDGLKLVAGKNKNVLKDQDKLVEILEKAGIDRNLIFKPDVLVGKSDLERLAGGKKKFEELTAGLYESAPSDPLIDKAESKKEEWKPGGDFDDVDVDSYE